MDSTPTPVPAAAPADASSNSPATGVVTAQSEADEEEQSTLNHNQVKEEVKEMVVSDKTEEKEKMQSEEDKEMRAPAAETGKKSSLCRRVSLTLWQFIMLRCATYLPHLQAVWDDCMFLL